MRETKIKRKDRVRIIIETLMQEYPEPESALDYSSPLQCLIATILSAQCTDTRVNLVTPALFNRYRTPGDFAGAAPEELESMIRSTGFFRNKAASIIKCCRAIVDRHDSVVPSTMDELVALDGVGRKTANCVLGNAYGQPAVMVDTHVKRLSRRMGFTRNSNPDKIEEDIKSLLPDHLWLPGSHALILHGRAVCKARKPRCSTCAVAAQCPKQDVTGAA
ncbi:MAG TPA: endonuclease III [bacterium]|nr:endonuclease III [bacterium]